MFLTALATLVSGVSDSASSAITGWSDRKTIKAQTKARIEEIKIASELRVAEMEAEAKRTSAMMKVEKAKTGQQMDFEMDMESIRQMKGSYKDELTLILFSTPLALSFIPSMQPYVLKGWEMLGKAPDWYLYLYGAMVVSIWGLRGIVRSALESKLIRKKP